MKVSAEELFEVVSVPGIPGYEEEIQEFIRGRLKKLGIKVEEDELGNLKAEISGEGEGRVLFVAHMDELGLVVTNLTEDGKIKFSKLGGIDDRILPAQHVIIYGGGKKIEGVIGFPPPHLKIEKEEGVPKWHELFIDVGASSKEELEALGIKPGDPIVFKKHYTKMEYEKVSSRGFDDRTGVYLLLKLAEELKNDTRNDVVLFFTVREEIGLHGAIAASHEIGEVNLCVAVDTINATDYPGLPGVYSKTISLGKGPVIRLVDRGFIVRRKVREFALKASERAGVEVQFGVTGGGTDAMAFGIHGGPRNSIPICIPTRYTHSTAEIEDLRDIESCLILLEEIANSELSTLRSKHKKPFYFLPLLHYYRGPVV